MNQDFAPGAREEMEARITALLLGELSGEDAAAVRNAIAQDPEWARIQEELARTIDLVREATATPGEDAIQPAASLRLSETKRQRLLQSFKTVAPAEFADPSHRELPWFIPLSVAAVLVVMIGSIALLPGFLGVTRRELAALSPSPARGEALEERASGRTRGLSRPSADLDALQPPQNAPSAGTLVVEAKRKITRDNIVLPPLAEAPTGPAPNEGLAIADSKSYASRLADKRESLPAQPGSLPTGAATESAVRLGGPDLTGGAGFVPGGFGGGGIGGGGFGGTGGANVGVRIEPSRPAVELRGIPHSQAGQLSANSLVLSDVSGALEGAGPVAAGAQKAQQGQVDRTGRAGASATWGYYDSDGRQDQLAAKAKENKVPTLGDVPLLGRFFRSESVLAESDKKAAPSRGEANAAGSLTKELASAGEENEVFRRQAGDVVQELGRTRAKEATNKFIGRYAYALEPSASQVGETLVDSFAANGDTAVPEAGRNDVLSRDSREAHGKTDNSGELLARSEDTTTARPSYDQLALGERRDSELMAGNRLGIPSPLPQPTEIKDTKAARPEEAKQQSVHPEFGFEYNLGAAKDSLSAPAANSTSPAAAEPGVAAQSYRMDPRLAARYGLMPSAKPSADENVKKLAQLDLNATHMTPSTAPSNGREPSSQAATKAGKITVTSGSGTFRVLSENGAPEIEKLGKGRAQATDRVRSIARLDDRVTDNAAPQSTGTADRGAKLDHTPSDGSTTLTASASRPEPGARPAEQPPTLWERLKGAVTGTYERTARLEVAKDSPDIAPLLYGGQTQTQYDPYFAQTEFEKIKSKAVLYRVIEKLNLNDGWARKHGAQVTLNLADTYPLLVKEVETRQDPDSSTVDIRVRDNDPQEAARIASTIADVYRQVREENRQQAAAQEAQLRQRLAATPSAAKSSPAQSANQTADVAPPKLAPTAPVPQPEVATSGNAFSTFSLNVSDVSFKLAAASLEKGQMPDPAAVRSEEFLNAFDYRDPEPAPGVPVGFAWEEARYPFAQDRDVLRFSVKTAAQGRQQGYPLNLVLLLDKSGSMERADRVRTVREALHVLAGQLQPQDRLSIVTFARTARLWAEAVPGNQAGQAVEEVSGQTPEGGTNLEDALNLAYQTALKHYIQGGGNRVILLTDGAANLGNVEPDALKTKVEANRKQGVALDCFGIGWEGFNDDVLEVLSSNGDGRYGFLNTPEEAEAGFAGQLAGALRVAAADVKVQVEFNPKRVTAYRQIGYAKHQLTKEQFRDNTVDAAELGAAESGNALYVVQVNAQGEGDVGWVRVRYREPATGEYREHEWPVPYRGNVVALEQASAAMRLASTAAAFSEWLVSSPYSGEITPDRLLGYLRGVPETYGADARPKKLEWMIRQAKSLTGK